MRDKQSNNGNFKVVALCVPEEQTSVLSRAFSEGLYRSDATTSEEMHALCAGLGKTVVFLYIPNLPAPMSTRVSAVFCEDDVKVIGLHPECTPEVFDLALQREFSGVLEANANASTCQAAAWAVHHGELWFPRSYMSRRLRASLFESAPQSLSEREADILRLLACGETNNGIADKLFISRDTVRWHLRSIYTKLGVSDRTAALRFARNKLQHIEARSSTFPANPGTA